MSGKKYMIALMFLGIIAYQQLFAYEEDFSSATFSGNIPSGWALKMTGAAYATLDNVQPQSPTGSDESGLCANFYNATLQNLLYRTVKIEDDIVCDTVLAKLRVYVKPQSGGVDQFQIVTSTNAWNSYEMVGEPIKIEESGRDSAEWVTYSRKLTLGGLADAHQDLYVGILLTPAGRSHDKGYIRTLAVNIAAAATPTDVCLKRDDHDVDADHPLLPGDSTDKVVMSVAVSPDPNDERLILEGVYGVVDRNGIVSTNKLVRVEGTDTYTNSISFLTDDNATFDAGEFLSISAFTKYTSTLPTAGVVNPDGYAYEDLDVPVRYVVGKAGSVWINELSAERVEICGTTNRVPSSGWTLVVASGDGSEICRASLGGAFNFAPPNMINGVVGIDVRDLSWTGGTLPTDGETYLVSLCNSRGIAEHTVQMALVDGMTMGQKGYAKWHEDAGYGYDWTGTATDGTFTWGALDHPSFGAVNDGQGFNVPVSVSLDVNTVISYATVVATVSNINNSTTLGTTKDFSTNSVDGVATLMIEGCTPFPNEIHAVLSGAAFGWSGETKTIVLLAPYDDEKASLVFTPTVAFDDFTSLANHWRNVGTLNWAVETKVTRGGRTKMLRLNTYSATSGKGLLKCQNYLSAHGREMCAVSFDYCNTVNTYASYDLFNVLVSTNADFKGVVKSTPALSDKRSEYGNDVWYRYQCVFDLPAGFCDAPELWIELQCVPNGKTHTYADVDNLRISFEDVALPTNLTRTVETPVSGGSTGFALDVLPQTTDEIQEVSADLHITVNGVKKLVPFVFADGALTNAIPLVRGEDDEVQAVQLSITPEALEKALGTRFYAGDSVTYYAAVHYNSANGDTDQEIYTELEGLHQTRYSPDNSKIDSEGRWIVEGGYKAIEDQYGFTVDGPDIDILGTPEITADGIAFDYHAWDRTGNKGIVGLTATVRKEGEEVSTTSLFEGAATNRVTDTCALTGLDANTEYTLTISGKRNSGGDLTSKSITFVTRPVLTAATIVGTSPNTAKLTASGQAAGFVVTPSDWVRECDSVQGDVRTMTWTRGEGTPNSQMSATVYATNKVGLASMTTNSPSGFTLAAVATKAPMIQKGTVTVDVGADKDYVAGNDGNPEGTEYAVRVTTSDGGDALVTTNGVKVWKTLADWKAEPVTVEKPTIDLLSTNYFSFITRNFDGNVSTNDSPVATNCWFDMTAEVAGAEQTATFGKVDVALKFSDPAQSDDARAEVEYKIVGQGDWAPVESFDVPFDEIEKTTNITWDAWTAVGEVEGTYEYLIRTKVTDAAHGRSSGWVELAESGTLDFVRPTVELTSKTHRSPFNTAPLKVDVAFSEDVVGFTKNAVKVGNGTVTVVVTNNASSYTVDIEPAGQGARVLDISVWVEAGAVTDVYGNRNVASKEPKPTWTYDTVPPTVTLTSDTHDPFNKKASPLVVTAEFSEPVVGLLKDWVSASNFSKLEIVTNSPSNYTISVTPAEDGDVTVTIAEGAVADLAGNPNVDAASLTHVYDTTPPELGYIVGWPMTLWTNTTAFSYTISATDKSHPITYEWTTNNDIVVSTATNFTGNVPGEGVHALFVTATDAAGNVSEGFSTVTWGVDLTKPTDPVIEAESSSPKAGAKTNDRTFSFTATSEDMLAVSFYWQIDNGPLVKKAAKEPFTGTFSDDGTDDGEHTVSVYSVDLAGNRSKGTTTQSWTLDTTAPVLDEITGTPVDGSATNGVEYSFSIALKKKDLTDVTFHWLTNGVWAADVTNFSDKVAGKIAAEGTYVASVYGTDAAGNVSVTNSRTWTVDWTAPTNLVVSGEPVNGSITNLIWFKLSAATMDLTTPTFHWALDGGKETLTAAGEVFKNDGRVADGDHTVLCYAVDEAFNVSETNFWRWTVDTQPPENFKFESTPKNAEVVATSNFNFKVSATDTTTVTYYWKTNEADYVALSAEKKDGAWVANFEGLASEGTNTLSVYGTDQLGNPTVTNSIWWVVDTIAPTNLVITGWPANGAYTNETAFSLKAEAMDATQLTYHWTLKRGEDTASTWEGQTFSSKSKLDDGDYKVMCYAEDEAHNVSATTNWTWTVDTVSPKVTLSSSTPTTFNEYKVPLIVDVTFGEAVTGFDGDCVTVTRGVVTNWTGSGSSYTVYIDPDDEEEHEAFVPVTVTIAAKEVRDLAGNPNEASNELQFRNVTKLPTVTLATETREPFKDLPFVVTATFVRGKTAEAAVVTNFTAESVSITNGTVTVWPDFATNVYTITITPKPDSVVTVLIPEGVVADDVGNQNVASTPLVRTYDVSKPANLRFLDSSTPAKGEVTASRSFNFEVTAEDLTALTYTWKLNKEPTGCTSSNFVSTADVPKGTNIVSVFATDAAGNYCDPITRTWIVDYIAPTNFAVTGTPGVMGEIVITNGTFFSYVADATDDTRITYCWTTNGVEVADNPTNLVGTAIETTNTVTCYAMDQAKNVSGTNTIVWVVDTIAPELGDLSGTPKAGDIVATNGFAFATSATDATELTYHWALNGKSVDCTTSNYVDAAAVEGTNTLQVWAEDAAGNVSKTTNTTWWVVDRIAPTVPELSGAPADGAITNGTGYGFTATSTDDHLDAYYWSLDGKAAPPALPGKMFEGNVAEGYATHSVEVYATDKAGNKSVPTNWTWTVDTVSPTNLVITGIPPAVTNVAAFTMTASALDDTAISYHWLTNGIEVVSTNLAGMATEGTNTVQVWAEDAAHNVSTTNTIRWVLDTIAPTKPVIDGTPKPKAVTNDKAFSFSATAEDKTALTFFWTVDEQKMTAPAFAGEVDGDGEHTVSVYATDAAGNVSPTNTFSWTLDTIAPDNLVITGTPADGSATNEPNYSLSATAEDATTLTFHWTLGDKTEAVTNFIGEVEEEGAYEVTCYATDAAGNSSVTNSWRWTFDMTPPTLPIISGTPANGSVTNKPNYDLMATATDDLTVITYHWLTNGVAAADVTNFVGEVNAEGVYVVSCYATDAANNVSETNVWSWTFDKTPPAALAISGKPEEGEVAATNGFAFAASATDLTDVSYRWTLNGSGWATGENFIGNAPEGTNTVKVTATDEAGNVSAVSRTWVVDTFAPTNLHFVVALPGDKVYTNDVNFAYMAVAEDATEMTFQWTLDDGAAGVRALQMDVAFTNDAPLAEGEHTVSVYAEDEAGNVSVTNSATWTVDLTPPAVTLSTETSEDHVINRTDVFKVTVSFSEPVAGFTKESVTVSNGTVTNVAASAENAYDVWIAPTADGEITVRIEANKVKDLAGNGNVASEPLTRTCDITPPSVTLSSNIKNDSFGPNDLIGNPFTVTVTFSETVTNFTASSVTVSNCTVKSVSPSTGAAKIYTVVIEPPDHDDVIAISIAGGAVTDLAGNGNTASDVLMRRYDRTKPTKPVITGTPASNSVVNVATYNLVARSEDFTDVTYFWSIDGASWRQVTNFTGVVVAEGKHTVQVYARDKVLNKSEVASWSWTYKSGVTPEGVSFGDSVQLKITDVSVTNVEFTAVDFQPGEESAFALREFELKGSQATSKEITDLKMWFVVGTNLLDYVQKRTWPVKVDENADFDNGTLTVTIPGEGTTDETGKPFESFFIFGVDNKGSDE